MVAFHDTAYLKWKEHLYPWSSAGYGKPTVLSNELELDVITPASSVAVLRQGYELLVHPSVS